MTSADTCVKLRVLQGEHGHNKVYQLAGGKHAKAHVIFFPGDQLQDRSVPPEVMRLQDPSTQARIVATKFPGASVSVVMPSRLEAGCACFDHFLNKTTQTGEPLGYQGTSFKASTQMWSLLRSAGCWQDRAADQPVVHLVGFSKGGVVLNQMLAELACFADLAPAGTDAGASSTADAAQSRDAGAKTAAAAASNDHPQSSTLPAGDLNARLPRPCISFLQAVAEVHYLDVGLNSRGAYMTDERTVRSLAQLLDWQKLHIFLHGTPRQWGDARRPWISQEKNMFVRLMAAHGLPYTEHTYFEGVEPNLLMHFQAIEAMQAGRQ